MATPQGQSALSRAARFVSAKTGRPLQPAHLLVALCIAALLVGRALLGGVAAAAAGDPSDAFSTALHEAYEQGYDDATAGLTRRPPKHVAMPGASSSAGWQALPGETARVGGRGR